jgi:hypothetical protein
MAPYLTWLPSRARALAVVAALVAVAIVAVLAASCGSTAQAPARPSRTRPLVTMFEAPQEMAVNPAGTIALLQHLGVDVVKVSVAWSSLAPDPQSRSNPRHFDATSPASYAAAAWTPYDAIAKTAAQAGMGLDFALEGPAPTWATGPGLPAGTTPGFVGAWEPSAKDYGQFVEAVGRRYDGRYKPPGATAPLPRVSFWSIWNEPNYGQWLAPQAIDNSTVEISPIFYRQMLDAAWSALGRTGHGHDTVLFGELAPRGQTLGNQPGNFSGMVPLRFLRALYCVDSSLHPLQGTAATLRSCPATAAGSKAFPQEHPALFHAAGFAIHPYPQGQVTPTVATPGEPDYADLAQLPSLERALDGAVAAYGQSTRFPIYSTEFGYITDPPQTITRAVNPTTAAYYLNWGEYISWRDARVASWDQYLLSDPAPAASSFASGLEFYGGKHKALYDAFRLPIYLPSPTGTKGHPLEVWGCVRPAHYAVLHSRSPQVASIQFKPGSGVSFKTVKRVTLTDAYGYFDALATFPSSGLVRISWSYPNHEQIHSRTVAIKIQ